MEQTQAVKAVAMSVEEAVAQAIGIASTATQRYQTEMLGGRDSMPCGFAWIQAQVKGSTKLGKSLMKLGFEKHYGKTGLVLWNPSRSHLQNVDAKLVGAEAAAKFLTAALGVEVFADSRWD